MRFVRSPPGVTQRTITRLLGELRAGNSTAIDELFPLVYDEIRSLAHRQRRRWRGNHTLDTTALVHEAYLKLVGQERIAVEDRAHFFALAVRAMRHIFCNYARDRAARKRGGGAEHVPVDEGKLADLHAMSDDQAALLVAVDEALLRLESTDPRQARVVECRFFGGMTVEETAAALGIAPRTVKRDAAFAQAWLRRELESSR